jgi:hypothetical protein
MMNRKTNTTKRQALAGKRAGVLLTLLLVLVLGVMSACGGGSGSAAAPDAGSQTAPAPAVEEDAPAVVVDATLTILKTEPAASLDPGAGGTGYLDEALGIAGAKILDFDYTVGAEKISGDKATVEVSFTTYGFGKVYEEAMDEFLTELAVQVVAAGAAADADKAKTEAEEEAEFDAAVLGTDATYALFAQKFVAKLGTIAKDYTATVEVPLTKAANGLWLIDALEAEGEFVNAIYGDMIHVSSEFNATKVNAIFLQQYEDAATAANAAA